MYYLICNALDNWVDPELSEPQNSPREKSVFICDNSQDIIEVLEPLRAIPSLSTKIDAIYSCSPHFVINPLPLITSLKKNALVSSLKKIYDDLLVMRSMCEDLGLEENSNGFDVKLPPNISLDMVSQCAHDLDVIFSTCPILRQDGCEIKLKGVDVGSAWLVFTIIGTVTGATIILNNLAALVDKAIILRSHWLSTKEQEERLRSLKIADDALEKVAETFKAALAAEREKIVDELATENKIIDNEEKRQLNYSVDKLCELMKKGAEIYAAVGSGNDVKAVFPPIESQALPEALPKYLTGNVEGTDE